MVFIALGSTCPENAKNNSPDQIAIVNTRLIKEFPGTFMIGSDKVGNFADYDREIGKYSPLFEVLERKAGEKAVHKVAHDNFLELMERLRERRGGSGLRLSEQYQYPERNYTFKSGKYWHENPRP